MKVCDSRPVGPGKEEIMWFWYCTPFSAFWWVFPLMFIACMVMMFLMMRMFFSGRFPCGMRRMHGARRRAETDDKEERQ
jgi:hypothetical protein